MWATVASALRNDAQGWQWARGLACVGSGLAGSLPSVAMKTAQVLQRMWLQACRKLGLLKGHVSLSLPAVTPSSFPAFPFRKRLGGGGGGGNKIPPTFLRGFIRAGSFL